MVGEGPTLYLQKPGRTKLGKKTMLLFLVNFFVPWRGSYGLLKI